MHGITGASRSWGRLDEEEAIRGTEEAYVDDKGRFGSVLPGRPFSCAGKRQRGHAESKPTIGDHLRKSSLA